MEQSQNLQDSLAIAQVKQQDYDRKRVTDLEETSYLTNSYEENESNNELNQGNHKLKRSKLFI